MAIKVISSVELEDVLAERKSDKIKLVIEKEVKMRKGTRSSAMHENPVPNPLNDKLVTKITEGSYLLSNESYRDKINAVRAELGIEQEFTSQHKGTITDWIIPNVLGEGTNGTYLCVYPNEEGKKPTISYKVNHRTATSEEVEIIEKYTNKTPYTIGTQDDLGIPAEKQIRPFYPRLDNILMITIDGQPYEILD